MSGETPLVLVCLHCHHEWLMIAHIPGRKIECPQCGSECIAVSPRMWPRKQEDACPYAPWKPEQKTEKSKRS